MSKSIDQAPFLPLTVQDVISGDLPTKLAQQADTLGPVLRWNLMTGPNAGGEMVYLIGPEANRLVFHTRREAFSHDLGWTPIIGDLFGTGLLNQDGAAWARSRKIWNPAFAHAYMETYLPLMQAIIAEHLADWGARGQVDLFREMREITFHVTAGVLAGIDRPTEIARMQQLFYDILPRAGGFATEADYQAYVQTATAANTELDATLLRLIAERRRIPPDAHHDVLGLIVHAQDDQGQTLTDDEVLGHLYILLVAGHETTTTLSAWTLYLLATQPVSRQHVVVELADLLGDQTAPMSIDVARNLHVMDRFIREVGRLHSPVQNVPRGVVEEVEFGGYTLPVGTRVRLAVAAGHRLSRCFADPAIFDPERFAPPRDEDRKTPYALVTFGGGPRLCIGMHFAQIEAKAIAEQVLRHFTWRPVSPEPPRELGFVTLNMPGGMPVTVQRK